MSVLAVDTSSRRRVVAVLASRDGTLERASLDVGGPVGVVLPRMLSELLGTGSPRAVVVVTGPGSYTGLRAGMAAALGVAEGRGLPLHGAGSLDAVAAAWDAGALDHGLVAIDAGRGFAYVAQCVRSPDGWTVGEPARLPIDAAELREGPVASTDDLPVSGLVRIDPAAAAAAAVRVALAAAALSARGLAARYVE